MLQKWKYIKKSSMKMSAVVKIVSDKSVKKPATKKFCIHFLTPVCQVWLMWKNIVFHLWALAHDTDFQKCNSEYFPNATLYAVRNYFLIFENYKFYIKTVFIGKFDSRLHENMAGFTYRHNLCLSVREMIKVLKIKK